ncbi:hypothetical protein D3C86_1730570 [compost metagenome]
MHVHRGGYRCSATSGAYAQRGAPAFTGRIAPCERPLFRSAKAHTPQRHQIAIAVCHQAGGTILVTAVPRTDGGDGVPTPARGVSAMNELETVLGSGLPPDCMEVARAVGHHRLTQGVARIVVFEQGRRRPAATGCRENAPPQVEAIRPPVVGVPQRHHLT